MIKKLATIDRRYIYLVIALCIIIPFLLKMVIKIREFSSPVLDAFNAIDTLPPGSNILISIDYDPASEPELQPMLYAVLHHAFKNNLKVIMMCHWPLGFPLGQEALFNVAKKYNKVYGEDFVNIGYRPGYSAVMLDMGREIRGMFPTDYAGVQLDSLPMMRGVHNYNDIAILVGFEAGATGDAWVQIANARFGQQIILGSTGVVAPDLYPYYQAKQILGIIGGLRGAAEYEKLVNNPGRGLIGMAAQSIAHVVIIIFIILGNIGYFVLLRKK